MEISTSSSPPLTNIIACNTNSVELKEFAALLRQVDEIEKLDREVEEKEDELSRFRKSLNILRKCYEQHSKDNVTLTRNVRQSTNLKKNYKKANN